MDWKTQNGEKKKILNENNKGMTPKKVYILSSLLGMLRAVTGFPIEQPLEAVKTQW